jgi:predicted signal transduction protein with EAL and GGDEF domain
MAILPEATPAGALHVAEKIVRTLAEPYPVENAEARLGASVGVAHFPRTAPTAKRYSARPTPALPRESRGKEPRLQRLDRHDAGSRRGSVKRLD